MITKDDPTMHDNKISEIEKLVDTLKGYGVNVDYTTEKTLHRISIDKMVVFGTEKQICSMLQRRVLSHYDGGKNDKSGSQGTQETNEVQVASGTDRGASFSGQGREGEIQGVPDEASGD